MKVAKFTVADAPFERAPGQAGEDVYLPRGAAVVITAHAAGAEIVYVTDPHWKTA